jgi:hypothetical protein
MCPSSTRLGERIFPWARTKRVSAGSNPRAAEHVPTKEDLLATEESFSPKKRDRQPVRTSRSGFIFYQIVALGIATVFIAESGST